MNSFRHHFLLNNHYMVDLWKAVFQFRANKILKPLWHMFQMMHMPSLLCKAVWCSGFLFVVVKHLSPRGRPDASVVIVGRAQKPSKQNREEPAANADCWNHQKNHKNCFRLHFHFERRMILIFPIFFNRFTAFYKDWLGWWLEHPIISEAIYFPIAGIQFSF